MFANRTDQAAAVDSYPASRRFAGPGRGITQADADHVASTWSNQSKIRRLNSDRAPASQCSPAPSRAVKAMKALSPVSAP
jgi:hypothetical protein